MAPNDAELCPIYGQPPDELFALALAVPTPAILYDLDGLSSVVRRLQADIALVPSARLNLALKACHTPPILSFLKELGLGCDVASIQELRLAKHLGFSEITTTAPAFSREDLSEISLAGITPDIDSLDQLALFGEHHSGSDVGLRVRLTLPRELESQSTFGADSRFGVPLARLASVLALCQQHGLRLTRLHIHCGQSTPASLVFKARQLLSHALEVPTIHTIDLGGGLFHMYSERSEARRALSEIGAMVESFAAQTGRLLTIRFEPGGALLSPLGYLVATVRSVAEHEHFGCAIATLDASAWNLAPWHRPEVVALHDRPAELREYHLAGNTLYEGDFFGTSAAHGRPRYRIAALRAGDRVLLTCAGAYTMTNGRRFHRLPLPREYGLQGGAAQRLEYSYEPGFA